MAAVQMLVTGPNVLKQNVIGVIPGKAKWVMSDVVLSTAVTSGGTFAAVAATTTSGALLPACCFVKNTTSDANVVVGNQ